MRSGNSPKPQEGSWPSVAIVVSWHGVLVGIALVLWWACTPIVAEMLEEMT